ncbi:hypothetical protein IFR09_24070 [Pseudomonas syringae]|nr:hypothetical protein [Pseudomonas syringae]MBD8575172.1 hypothetical protein [Pseudomonas syringae]MBD8788065.1 hypothetical protein [Pseudomonas syringae]MBD8799736.1 hypothetical protein [Pseudomonas syringae]MBD8814241.1 hypothetical protein [Pseudomonas syringae]
MAGKAPFGSDRCPIHPGMPCARQGHVIRGSVMNSGIKHRKKALQGLAEVNTGLFAIKPMQYMETDRGKA